MSAPIRVATLENEIQARLLSALLDEEGIRHNVCSYHDSAYDGLFQTERGWGHIEAHGSDAERIVEILNDLKNTDNTP